MFVPHPPHRSHPQRFSSRQQLLQSPQILHPVLHHLLEQRRRQPQRRDPVFPQQLSDLFHRLHSRRRHHQRTPVQQTPPYLERRCIETHRRQLQHPLALSQFRVIVPPHQPHHSSMRHHDPFRLPRRSRRVHHIRALLPIRPALALIASLFHLLHHHHH